MRTSETIDKLAAALVKVQEALTPVHKSASGYNYKYAPLDSVIEAARPILVANGLAVIQAPGIPQNGGIALTTRILHTSGQWLEDTMEMPIPEGKSMNAAQAYGSGLTYARRYGFAATIGIVDTEDIDAASPNGKPVAPVRKDEPQTPPPPTENGDGLGHLTDLEMAAYRNDKGILERIADDSDRWDSVHPVKAAFKLLGFTAWPKGNDMAEQRVIMCRQAIAYARSRNHGFDQKRAISDAQQFKRFKEAA